MTSDTSGQLNGLSAEMSTREAASLLGVHERTVRRAIANGALPAVREGHSFRISRATFDRYQRRQGPQRTTRWCTE